MPVTISIKRHPVEACPGNWCGRLMLARQQAARQWVIRHDGDVVIAATRNQLLLDAPGQQVVHWLHGYDWLPAVFLSQPQHLTDLPGSVVRDGDATNLAGED